MVGYDARVGKATLASIIDTDEGAAHLGEVALISKNTPIRESGVLFYDTLYDENASCHLALGCRFPRMHRGWVTCPRRSSWSMALTSRARTSIL